MSFGFSIGDIFAVSKLAHDIWGRVRDSSDQFKAIRTEFRGLYIVLDDVAQGLPGLKLDPEQTAHLASLVQGSQSVLDDTNAVLEKFESLGVKSSSLKARTQKAWKKVTWDDGSVIDLRGRIISNTTLLSAFIVRIASKTALSTNDKVTVLDGRVQNLQSHNDDRERQKILDWISPLNFALQQSTILDQRQEGTGQWFLESREFQEWMNTNRATLLCIGMPGAGKTMLASIAIEYLVNTFRSQQDIGVCYIYCDYKIQDEQTPLNLLASLLKQLLQYKSSVPEDIRGLYKKHNNGTKTTRPILDEVFESLQLTAASFSQVYLVVDALDELQQHGKMFQILLSKLSTLQATTSVDLMLTSRDIPRVTEEVQEDVRLEVRANNEDVARYVDGHLDELPRFVSKNPKIQQDIKDAIVSAVDGMFLLARLHLESLVDKMCPADVRVALESLPKGLAALSIAYDQAMQRIAAQRPGVRLLAQNAMSWITYAKRLLTVVEVRYALGIRHGTSHFDEESLCNIDDIVSACGGLVIVDQGQDTDTVRLVHYSTQEFMRQAGGKYFLNAQEHIAVSCLTYLLYDDFDGGWWYKSRHRNEKFDRVDHGDYTTYMMVLVQCYPFVVYAAQHWATHASKCSEQSVRDATKQFLSDEHKVSSAAQVLFLLPRIIAIEPADRSEDDNPYIRHHSLGRSPMSGMHLVAFFGVREIVSMLLANGFAADVRDVSNRSPLFWAALNGHTAVVDLLLSLNDIGIDLKSQDDRISSMSAVSRGEIPGVQRLVLHEDVDLNAEDIPDQTGPVSRAAEDVSRAIVKKNLTLSAVDVNCQDISGATPLMMAANGGHDEVVARLLKSSNISVNLRNKDGSTPLMMAANGGHDEVVARLLKSSNISVNLGNKDGSTPLLYAVQRGKEAIVRLLVTRADVDVNLKSTGYYEMSPLFMATARGDEAVVQTLLSHAEIDVNIRDRGGLTPLIVAAYRNHEGIAKLLLAHHSIDVNCKSRDGRTALIRAAHSSHHAIVKLLLRCTGIDLDSKDNDGHTPLSQAAYGWLDTFGGRMDWLESVDFPKHEATVKLLLTRTDIDIECIDENGNNLLTRITKAAQKYSQPRLKGTISLLRAAMADRSRTICEDQALHR